MKGHEMREKVGILLSVLAVAFVSADAAADSYDFARKEYEDHLAKLGVKSVTVSGRPAEIEFVRKRVKEGDDDSFRIRAKGGKVTVEGGTRGVLYGLYELLERYAGVVWCASWYTHIPKPGRFDVPDGLDETQSPAFPVRWPGWAIPMGNDPLLAVRLRYNSTGVAAKYPEYGGVTYRCPPNWGEHTYGQLCPVEKYGKDHPEYFSEIRGRRQLRQTQLCTTNPDVRRISKETLFNAIRKHPECDYWAIGHNDYDFYCECEKCKAINDREESPMGCELEFVNYLADEVAKEFPGKLIKTSAYDYARKPPKFLRPRDNVVINICAIECDVANPLGTPGEPEKNRAFMRDFDIWCSIAKNVAIYDYTPNYRYFMHPFPNLPTIAGNLRFYRSRGVTRLFNEGGTQHADLAELKVWLLHKLAWDPQRDLDTLIDTFCRAYYGAAAENAKRYIRESRASIDNMKEPRLGIFEENRPEVFTHAFLDRMIENFRDGERKLKNDPARLHNLRMTAAIPYVTKLDYMADEAIWWWATEKPKAFPGSEKAAVYFDWVEKCAAEAKAKGYAFLFSANRGWNAGTIRSWKRLKAWKRPAAGSRSGWVPAAQMERALLKNGFKGGWYVRETDDPAALSKGAVELNTEFENCILWFSTKNLALDAGRKYRVRVRMRGEPGARPDGEAFCVKGLEPLSVTGGELTADYSWYDLGTMTGGEKRTFDVYVGRVRKQGDAACKNLFMDGFEFAAID